MTPPRPDRLGRLRHDLRTPLTIVAGFAELLAGDRPLTDEERRSFAERISGAAADMRRLLDESEDRPAA
jgi:signal transduction histidine kinase